MQQPLPNTDKTKKGGARIGSGRKKQDVQQISLTIPADQVAQVDEYFSNRSKAYTEAMELLLAKRKAV